MDLLTGPERRANSSGMVKQWRKRMFNKILVPTDGSLLSDKASRAAVEFAAQNGSEIVAFSVAEPYLGTLLPEGSISSLVDSEKYNAHVQDAARSHVDKIASLAKSMDVRCTASVALAFSPYEKIIEASRTFNCDVIFMATHGRKGLNRLFVGSETQKVLAHSTIPVMVFR
jgi:nucleotide-binding universal stress UspA family protein